LAKYGEITFKDGKAQQGNFDDYPVLRIDEAPQVTNVHIMPPGDQTPPAGVGEPGVPPVAPALINAIFAATGQRIRALPIGKQMAMLTQQDGQVTRPRSAPQSEQSTSNQAAPDATTKQPTGTMDPSAKVKQMNDDADRKTQIEGK